MNPEVVLNEIFFNPIDPARKFVELYYNGSGTIDITGYEIVADTIYTIPAGADAVLSPTERYYHLREFEDPAFFAALTASGDNVYLYDDSATPVLQDMGGWTTAHGPDLSMTRMPDGVGTFDGYDDMSSQLAGWVFNSIPTYSIVLVWNDQEQWGDPGHFVWYLLNVTNKQGASDCIDITYQPGANGWSVELYESDQVTPLIDKEPAPGCPTADGIPDTGPLAPGGVFKFWAKVNLDQTPMFGTEVSMVIAQASLDTLGRDMARLTTLVNPWIQPDAKIEDPPHPTTIYEKSAGALGFTNETVITLNATGVGFQQFTGQDVVFILDSSGSMQWNDNDPDGPCNGPPMNAIPRRVNAAWEYVDNLSANDRGGYVDFDSVASLRVPLDQGTIADGFKYLKEDATRGLWCSDQLGGTMFSPALNEANFELINNGDPGHVKVEILLTDGESSVGAPDYNNGRALAQEAADNDIIIFTIGLTVTNATALQFLGDIAMITGGRFFPAPNATVLSSIFTQIMDLVRNIAGYNPDPSNPSLMIEFVLEEGIDYIDGTFQLVPGTIETDPVPDSIEFNPTNTTLQWNWTGDQLRVIEYWAVKFNISSTKLGFVPVNVVPDSAITYMTSNGMIMTREFPLVMVTVITPSLQPLITDVTVDPGGVNIEFTSVVTAEYYEIYGGPAQTSIDLITILGTVNAPQTSWVDTNRPALDPDEYYYVVRAVDTGTVPATKSLTSNTAGYFRVTLEPGTNAISTPLKPLAAITLDSLLTDVGATSLSILDANDDWQTYVASPPGAVQLGEGYVLEMPPGPALAYWFTGEPVSMVLFQEGFGFDDSTRDDLSATVNPAGDVTLTWSVIPNAEYYVYWSATRDGFFRSSFTILNGGSTVSGTTYTHTGAVSGVGENYYMIIPYDTVTGTNGSSSYSIGIWTTEYNGNELIGLPLKPLWGSMSADWYVDQIPSCLGIVFLENGEWKAHFREFPEGIYDTIIERGRGYEITVFEASLFSFIGY
jgi:hypothetical protein